jgi:pimeloyl-ACP methyl ester carboxylesterase
MEWTHEQAICNDVRMHYVTAGPEDGDLVLLLHGFPEFWYTWREQLDPLAEAGFRVVAPDLRGYNRSEKPPGVASYHLDDLVGDVAGLVEHFDRDQAHLVGHDWGGLIAWALAINRPAVVDRLAVLNAPHPASYARGLTRTQVKRSWYTLYFQLPWLPEFGLKRNDFEALERLFREEPTNPDAFTEDDLRRYKEALERPGALSAGINYYRALVRTHAGELLATRVPRLGALVGQETGMDTDLQFWSATDSLDVPTLVCWGEQDFALGVELTETLDEYVADLTLRRYPDASHWVHLDVPDEVNEELVTFLGNG